jgi:diamine N-acetyltransferase
VGWPPPGKKDYHPPMTIDPALEEAPGAKLRGATLSLREVTTANLREVLRLRVAPAQERFVAPNAVSVAEAYFHRDVAWFRALYAGEAPVGFLMLEDRPEEASYHLWRFMVDARYQGMGLGARGLHLLIEHVRARPGATRLTLSCVPAEGGPGPFYEKQGFAYTGEEEDGELVMSLPLAGSPAARPAADASAGAPRLRRAAIGDAAEIARLSGQLGYASHPAEIGDRVGRLLTREGQLVLVAPAPDGRLLGWIAAERRLLLESGERAEIVGLVVDGAARRRGIGAALVAAAERWAAAQGQRTVFVRSNVVRAESHPFYESLGYARRKTQHAYAKVLRDSSPADP